MKTTKSIVQVYCGEYQYSAYIEPGTETLFEMVEHIVERAQYESYTFVIHNGESFTAASSRWRNRQLRNGDVINIGKFEYMPVATGTDLDALCKQLFHTEQA